MSILQEIKKLKLEYDIDFRETYQKLAKLNLPNNDVHLEFVERLDQGKYIALSISAQYETIKKTHYFTVKTRSYTRNIMLEKLSILWEQHPESRFGQLMVNINDNNNSIDTPLYYREDEDLIESIDYVAKNQFSIIHKV